MDIFGYSGKEAETLPSKHQKQASTQNQPSKPPARKKYTRKAGKRSIPIPERARQAHIIGAAWCTEHKEQLAAAGWHGSDLFRRGRFRYPLGNWGLAYSSAWLQPDVKAAILPDGSVAFQWQSGTRQIVQTERVPAFSKWANRK